MFKDEYFVVKTSGTYAEILETYGLSKLLAHILKKNNIENPKITIEDNGPYFSIKVNPAITEEMLISTPYFAGFPYIKAKKSKIEDIPSFIIDFEREMEIKNKYKKWRQEVLNKIDDKKKKRELLEEYPEKTHIHYDLFSKIAGSPLSTYNTIFKIMDNNKNHFQEILKQILLLYSIPADNTSIVIKNVKKIIPKPIRVTSLQFFNPHQGKGVNASKSNSISLGQVRVFWLKEYLKMIGIYGSMFIRDIKLGKDFDSKYYVISPQKIDYEFINDTFLKFKKLPLANSNFKVDIIATLTYAILLLDYFRVTDENIFSKRFRLNNLVSGFSAAYQKKMSQFSKSVTNISFLQFPDFIEVGNSDEVKMWKEIIEEHKRIIKNVKESHSSTTQILIKYRRFITTGDWDDFFEFNIEYSTLLMKDILLTSNKMYLRPFRHLEELFMTEKKFKAILESQGFKNIAKAIRRSTISEQYAKAKNKREIKYEIRYGIAQDLKRKSAYKEDLIEYISEFIAQYNSETSRIAETHPELLRSKKLRSTIKSDDVDQIISLIDEFGAPIVGKLLAAYGYSLEKHDSYDKQQSTDHSLENNKGGN